VTRISAVELLACTTQLAQHTSVWKTHTLGFDLKDATSLSLRWKNFLGNLINSTLRGILHFVPSSQYPMPFEYYPLIYMNSFIFRQNPSSSLYISLPYGTPLAHLFITLITPVKEHESRLSLLRIDIFYYPYSLGRAVA
jgi:hypothetical protein